MTNHLPTPEELLGIKEEISKLWDKLPPEHQATMLLVLHKKSQESEWVQNALKLLKQSGQR